MSKGEPKTLRAKDCTSLEAFIIPELYTCLASSSEIKPLLRKASIVFSAVLTSVPKNLAYILNVA